jgi:acyl carrier protein
VIKVNNYNKLKKIAGSILGIDDHEGINHDADFITDLGADSLDQIEMLMAMEECFAIEVCDEMAENIRSIQDAYNYINACNFNDSEVQL